MRNVVKWVGIAVFGLLLDAPRRSDAAIEYEYILSGVTNDAAAAKVSASLYFYLDTPIVSSTPASTVYGPTQTYQLAAYFALNGSAQGFVASTYNSTKNFISVQHGAGLPDVFQYFVNGFQLTLSNSAGTAFSSTSLGMPLSLSEFDSVTLSVPLNGNTYNVNVTQFSLAATLNVSVPEPPSMALAAVAGFLGLGWRLGSRRVSRL